MLRHENPQDHERGRDYEIYDLVVRHGCSQYRVGEKFGISQQRVSQVVGKIDDELRLEFIKQIRTLRTRHQQLLEEIVFQAMEGWHRSYGETEIVTEGQCKGAECGNNFVTTTTKTLAGDPRFLQLAADVLQQIRKMWDGEMKSAGNPRTSRRVAGRSKSDLLEDFGKRLKNTMEKLEQNLEN